MIAEWQVQMKNGQVVNIQVDTPEKCPVCGITREDAMLEHGGILDNSIPIPAMGEVGVKFYQCPKCCVVYGNPHLVDNIRRIGNAEKVAIIQRPGNIVQANFIPKVKGH